MTKKERTQKEILHAAKELIHSSGYESITVRHLASKTGYSYSNMYYYFKDLKELLWELRSYMIEDMILELTTKDITYEDSVGELILTLMTYVNYYYNHFNVFRFFYFYPFVKPSNDTNNDLLAMKFNAMWDKTFKKLLDEKIIDFDNIEIIVNALLFSIHGMILLNFSQGTKVDLESSKKQLTDIVFRILNINKDRKDLYE